MRITQEVYDQNTSRYRKEQDELSSKIRRLKFADEEYYVTSTYLLHLIEKAEKLYTAAEVDEKRQILSLICQNLYFDGKKLSFNLKEPFNVIANYVKGYQWRA